MHHAGGFIGIALIVLLLVVVALRLARSFRRTTRMLNSADYWDPTIRPGPPGGGPGAGPGGGSGAGPGGGDA